MQQAWPLPLLARPRSPPLGTHAQMGGPGPVFMRGRGSMSKRSSDANDAVHRELRAFGFTYPGHRKSPRPGHDDLAVNNKTFAYLSNEGEPFSVSIKLPYSKHECRSYGGGRF